MVLDSSSLQWGAALPVDLQDSRGHPAFYGFGLDVSGRTKVDTVAWQPGQGLWSLRWKYDDALLIVGQSYYGDTINLSYQLGNPVISYSELFGGSAAPGAWSIAYGASGFGASGVQDDLATFRDSKGNLWVFGSKTDAAGIHRWLSQADAAEGSRTLFVLPDTQIGTVNSNTNAYREHAPKTFNVHSDGRITASWASDSTPHAYVSQYSNGQWTSASLPVPSGHTLLDAGGNYNYENNVAQIDQGVSFYDYTYSSKDIGIWAVYALKETSTNKTKLALARYDSATATWSSAQIVSANWTPSYPGGYHVCAVGNVSGSGPVSENGTVWDVYSRILVGADGRGVLLWTQRDGSGRVSVFSSDLDPVSSTAGQTKEIAFYDASSTPSFEANLKGAWINQGLVNAVWSWTDAGCVTDQWQSSIRPLDGSSAWSSAASFTASNMLPMSFKDRAGHAQGMLFVTAANKIQVALSLDAQGKVVRGTQPTPITASYYSTPTYLWNQILDAQANPDGTISLVTFTGKGSGPYYVNYLKTTQ